MSAPEFAILGAGALGSILGAHLARAGHSVLMLSRGKRAQLIAQSGLRIRGLADFSQTVSVSTDMSRFTHADVLIIATKAIGTDATLSAIRHAEVGTVFSVQNGVMKNAQLSAIWGEQRVLGALADISGEILPNGDALFTRNEQLRIGELAGAASGAGGDRASRIAAAIDAAGVRTAAVADIEILEWAKFAGWIGLMGLAVITRAPTWKFLSDPDLARVLARLVREVASLATARGIELSDRAPLPIATLAASTEAEAVAIIRAAGEQMKLRAPEHRMSALQDVDAGRPIEVEETVGYAVREAARANLSLPLLDSFHALVAGIDRCR